MSKYEETLKKLEDEKANWTRAYDNVCNHLKSHEGDGLDQNTVPCADAAVEEENLMKESEEMFAMISKDIINFSKEGPINHMASRRHRNLYFIDRSYSLLHRLITCTVTFLRACPLSVTLTSIVKGCSRPYSKSFSKRMRIMIQQSKMKFLEFSVP